MTAKGKSLPVLPPLPALTPATLLRFDLSRGVTSALRTLSRELGRRRTARLVWAMVVRSQTADPVTALPPSHGARAAMTRSQLRSVLLLFDALKLDLGLDDAYARSVLRAVMHDSGARFVTHFQPSIRARVWKEQPANERSSYASNLVGRLFNAEVADVAADAESISFDVTRCAFVDALRMLGREDVAPFFCEVDEAFAKRDGSELDLERKGTIARGASRCDFRFTFSKALPERR